MFELTGNIANPKSKEEEKVRIVATGFNNYAMLFIKYKTGDIAVLSYHNCNCERNYPLLNKYSFFKKIQEFLLFRLLKKSYSEKEISEHILKLFKERFEGLFKLKLNFVGYIPRTRSGKYRYLIQKLPIEFVKYKK